MKKYNYLYKITNKINGKIYIGIHSTNKLNDKYMGSGGPLLKAKQAKTISAIAWKEWDNLDEIKERHKASCTKAQRKHKAWENYDQLKEIWIKLDKPKYGAFNTALRKMGYDKRNYQRIVDNFLKEEENELS